MKSKKSAFDDFPSSREGILYTNDTQSGSNSFAFLTVLSIPKPGPDESRPWWLTAWAYFFFLAFTNITFYKY